MISKKGGRVLAMPQNKALESTFSGFFCLSVPCFRQDRMLIPLLTLMEVFTKERRINVGRRTTEVWFPVGLASWLNC